MSRRPRKSPLGPARGIVKPRTRKPAGWGRSDGSGGYAIRLTLAGTDPPVWRLLEVPDVLSLHLFHLAIQIVMPWENRHLYEYLIGGERWGIVGPAGYWPAMGVRDARHATLADVLPGVGFTFRYMYDWGDMWEHELTVEKVLPPGKSLIRPRCTDGEGAAPPEDCGGTDGFYEMLAILEDPAHPDHARNKLWLGGDFDPDLFNTLVADQLLRHLPEPEQWEPASQNPAEFFNYFIHRAIEEEKPVLSRKRDFEQFMKVQEHRFEELADPDYGGLSSRQYNLLINDEWDRPESAMIFDRSLPAEELSGITAFEHSHGFLASIDARGGCIPIQEGGIPEPAFVTELLSRREWSQWLPDDWEPPAADESGDTTHPVDELGRLLKERSLLRINRGRMCLTKQGRRMLAPEHAGDLLAEMFLALFALSPDAAARSGNLDTSVRKAAAFALWRFSVLPCEWYDLPTLAVELLPATITERIAAAWEYATSKYAEEVEAIPGLSPELSPRSAIMITLDNLLLCPLYDFGLLERRGERQGSVTRRYDHRRSPLLERFIHFEGLPTEPFLMTEWLS